MKKFILICLLMTSTGFAQDQITEKELKNCPEKTRKAYAEFVQSLSKWNSELVLQAVLKDEPATADEKGKYTSMVSGVSGRGKQFHEVTGYGLMKYCNQLDSLEKTLNQ